MTPTTHQKSERENPESSKTDRERDRERDREESGPASSAKPVEDPKELRGPVGCGTPTTPTCAKHGQN